MTTFAMTIYMYQQTHSATAMAFVQVAYITPFLIMSPIAGVMVDRYNRKLMMMISDIAGATATLIAPHLVRYRASAILAYLPGLCRRGHWHYVPVAGLFGGDQRDGSQGTVWSGKRHDVADRGRPRGAFTTSRRLAHSPYPDRRHLADRCHNLLACHSRLGSGFRATAPSYAGGRGISG